MSDEPEEEEEEYPPWLSVILDDDAEYWDEVVVLEPASDAGRDKEWMEVKAIEAPDTTDAAAGAGAGQCRTYTVQRYVTILVASEASTPPYIGLVDKVFLRRDAKKVRMWGDKPVYRLSDFGVQAYWFYRPVEVPGEAWDKDESLESLQEHMRGRAQYKLTDKSRLTQEDYSERQVLFSSHHTLHDYPDDKGILAMDGFLQACKVHWLGADQELPPRYEVHGSTLVVMQEPGFVVRGFLWCAAKTEPQYAPDQKEIYRLGDKWPDKDTCAIVRAMCKRYEKEAVRMSKRNKAVVERFHAAKAAKRQTIPSDDGDDPAPAGAAAALLPAAAAAAAAGGGVASPRLDGVVYAL